MGTESRDFREGRHMHCTKGSRRWVLAGLVASGLLAPSRCRGSRGVSRTSTVMPAVAAAAQTGTITIEPEADTMVMPVPPDDVDLGTLDYFDTYGGRNPSCVPYSGPVYGLLRFDLSAIPAGSVISDARIVTTTRAGSPRTAPATTMRSSSPTTAGRDGRQVGHAAVGRHCRTRQPDLGERRAATCGRRRWRSVRTYMWRDSCNADFQTNQTKTFPTNGFDARKTLAAAKADLIGHGWTSERAGDGKLSIELYNPNCPPMSSPPCNAGPNTAYWARYWSHEATDPSVRPYLEVTVRTRQRSRATTGVDSGPSRSTSTGRRRARSTSAARLGGTASRSSPAPAPAST